MLGLYPGALTSTVAYRDSPADTNSSGSPTRLWLMKSSERNSVGNRELKTLKRSAARKSTRGEIEAPNDTTGVKALPLLIWIVSPSPKSIDAVLEPVTRLAQVPKKDPSPVALRAPPSLSQLQSHSSSLGGLPTTSGSSKSTGAYKYTVAS